MDGVQGYILGPPHGTWLLGLNVQFRIIIENAQGVPQ